MKAEFISVVRTNQPTKPIDKVIPRFYAHVPRLQEFSSVVGMSRGPIIKFTTLHIDSLGGLFDESLADELFEITASFQTPKDQS